MMEQMREEFEEWLESAGYTAEKLKQLRKGNYYTLSSLQSDWSAWQAAHAKYVKNESRLVNGRIPAGQECPFTSTCL